MTDLTLTLAGPVSVLDADGIDRTPVSMKARGLLALIGTATDLRMSRPKLQDKLWSDRQPEHGSASLRQALSEIRRRLGPLQDVIVTGPGWVGLDRSRVAVVLDPPSGTAHGTVEFAEDLFINDPEFEDWLLVQRQYFDNRWRKDPVASPQPIKPFLQSNLLCLVLSPARTGQDDVNGLVQLAMREAANRAASFLPISVFNDRAAEVDFPAAIEVSANGFLHGDELVLQVSLTRLKTGQELWVRTYRSQKQSFIEQIKQLSGEVTFALLNVMSQPLAPGVEPPISLPDIFSFSPERLLRAQRTLAALPETHLTLALQAYIGNTLYLERLTKDSDEALDEAFECATRALELAPFNSTALAIAAVVASQKQKTELCGDLAQRALQIDPINPLARTSLSLALAGIGDYDAAHAEALRARQEPLAALSPASWAIFCAVTAVRARRFEEARGYSLISHGYAPNFRPALRFLGALQYRLGNHSGAEEAFYKLRDLEPDFSLQLMASTDYPVASLRAAELMDVTRSGLI